MHHSFNRCFTQRKSKDDTGVDAFFWPTMPWNAVMGKTDMKNSKCLNLRFQLLLSLCSCTVTEGVVIVLFYIVCFTYRFGLS